MTEHDEEFSRRVTNEMRLVGHAERLGGLGFYEWVPSRDRLRWSDSAFRVFGLEPGSITPTRSWIVDRTHERDRARVEASIDGLVVGGPREVGFRMFGGDGRMRFLRASVAAVDAAEGDDRVLGAVQDVSSRTWLEREVAVRGAATAALRDWSSFELGLRGVLLAVATALDARLAALWLPGPAGHEARAVWHAGTPADAAVAERTRAWTPGAASPTIGRALTERRTILVRALAAGGDRARTAAMRDAGLREIVAIPATTDGHAVAVIEVLTDELLDRPGGLPRSLDDVGLLIGQALHARRGDLTAPPLTSRERDVLRRAAGGGSTATIAAELHLSPATVKRHFERCYQKLGVSSRASAVASAMRLGLIE